MVPTRFLSGAALVACACSPLFAAEAPQPTPTPRLIPDVIITAERRADPAQALPMAVTVFTADRVQQLGVQTPLGVLDFVPNLVGSNSIGLGSANVLSLRGLGNAATDTVTSPAVATFLDDIYLGRPNGSNFGLFDINRIEVLRGPQATLYGRNTSGGAINVVLDRPVDRVAGTVEFGAGGYGRKLLRGSINLPFSPAVAFKLSGYWQNDSGYVHNTTTGERLNDSDMAGLRGAVQLAFSDQLRWNVAATYMRNDGDNLANATCDPNAPTVCNARFAATGRRIEQPLGGTNPLIPLGSRLDTQMYTSHLDWAGENLALAAITGFINTRERFAIDLSDGRPAPSAAVPSPVPIATAPGFAPVTSDGDYDQFSQELRLTGSLLDGRIDVIAGLLYFDAKDRREQGTTRIETGVTDKAAYLQADINVTDRLKLTAGTRYTDETVRFGSAPAAIATQTTKQWSPRLAASYRAADALLVYASAARGWRSAGWDSRPVTGGASLPFGAEAAWTYEGGIKADALAGRVRANLAAFWIEARDSQVPLLLGTESVVQTIDGYRNRGVELELIAAPITGLTLRTSLAYQKDRYNVGDGLTPNALGVTSVAGQQAQCRAQLAAGRVPLAGTANTATACAVGIVDANGNAAEPVRTPDFSAAFGAAYDWAIPAAGAIITPSVDAVYRSRFEAGAANATLYTGTLGSLPANPFAGDIIAGSHNPAVWQVTAALTLRTDDNHWTLTLSCTNCLDAAYTQSTFGTVSYLNPPRLWQVRARRVF
jgi:iron complex outermembrane recepter protein